MGTQCIYEVNLAVEPGSIQAFDAWLPGHIDDVLSQPGFLSAELMQLEEADEHGWQQRTVQYRLESRQALDDYLAGPAETLRADGVQRFGHAMRAWRRVMFAKPGPIPAPK